MKKLLIGLLFSICGVSHAITYQSVRASTNNVDVPSLQTGTMNLSSGTVIFGNFPTLKSTGTATLSGTVTLGGAAKSVTVSSNAVLSGALIANGSAGTSGYVLQSQGPGTTPTWVSPASESILSSTNTWTGGQTFNSSVTFGSTATFTSSTTFSNVVSATAAFVNVSTITMSSAIATAFSATASTITTLNSTTIVVTTITPTGIVGTTTNNSANVGNYGEYKSSVTANNVAYPTSGNFGDLLSLFLTAGDWDVSVNLYATANGATNPAIIAGISTTAGNNSTGLVIGDNRSSAFGASATADSGTSVSNYRQSLSAGTTVYFKYYAEYTVATPQAKGRISARRMR